MKIRVDNGKCKLMGDRMVIHELRELTKIRKPGAFYSPAYGHGWDGYVRYISDDTGAFNTGLLPWVLSELRGAEIEYTIEDVRSKRLSKFKLRREFENGDLLRDVQEKSALSILNNSVEGIPFQRGILNDATNAGKSYVMASLLGALKDNQYGIVLINNKEIFTDLYNGIKELLGDEVGLITSKKTDIRRFNVAMVQTLAGRLRKDIKLRSLLGKQTAVLVDECDEVAHGKQGKLILGYSFNAIIRVALSGTAIDSKDKTRIKELESYFGPVVNTTTNKELVTKGYSVEPIITFLKGNKRIRGGSFQEEYEYGIINNRHRHIRIWKRVQWHLDKGREKILILVRYHRHIRKIMQELPIGIGVKYIVEATHSETSNRKEIIKRFKKGKSDILVCSLIVKRGKNLPFTKVLINAAGGDTKTYVKQILGRSTRTHKTKKKVYVDDFWDLGKYLRKHSNHRYIYFKNEGFRMIDNYKK